MRHQWIVGERALDRLRVVDADIVVSAHRQLGGPFAGAAEVLAELVPEIHERWPELALRHRYAILTVAPELEELIGPVPKTLQMAASAEERTRFQAGLPRRASQGITELLTEYAQRRGRLRLGFDAVQAADPTDQEFLAILLRRSTPELVQVQVGTTTSAFSAELAAALDSHAVRVAATPVARRLQRSDEQLLHAFVASAGSSDDPAERAAWERADPDHRAELHDKAAVASPGLGARVFHRMHGTDPAGAGVEAAESAVRRCLGYGFFPAAAEFARLGLALITPDRQPEYCRFQGVIATTLRTTDPVAAEAILNELRGLYALPQVHLSTSYSLSILHSMFHAERNQPLAKAYAQNALALAGTIEVEQGFLTSFHLNGLALVEMNSGRLEEAARLVTLALEALVDDRYEQHRSVLFHNRAKVHQALGLLDEAKRDFDTAVESDPYFPEFRYDRANLARLQGDDEAALADYEAAMAMSAPITEAYYSRGDLRATQGDLDGAIADFAYVLELEPEHLDARINRAALLLESGDLEAAVADVAHGLDVAPGNAHLLCTQGLIALERDRPEQARASFEIALAAAPNLYEALVNVAILDYDDHNFDAATEKLTRALELAGDDPDLLYNRGLAHQAAGRLDDAAADYLAALDLPGADAPELHRQLALCHPSP
jgi:tetratricopeptide (TPR) repeat protein